MSEWASVVAALALVGIAICSLLLSRAQHAMFTLQMRQGRALADMLVKKCPNDPEVRMLLHRLTAELQQERSRWLAGRLVARWRRPKAREEGPHAQL